MKRNIDINTTSQTSHKNIGLWSAVAIGVGGMIGAGIFSLLGVATSVGGDQVYIAFIIAAIVALPCGYSYAKLGATYPSAGGPVEYLLQTFGDGLPTGMLNNMLWLGYIFALALYARAFGGYATALFGMESNPWMVRIFGSALIMLFVILNSLGSGAVGRAELYIVILKVAILVIFAGLGLFLSQNNPLTFSGSITSSTSAILYTSGIVFLAYEGFGLITNAAGDMKDPARTLPRAIYLSLFIALLVYVLVCLAVTANLSAKEVVNAKEYALAQAAQPFLGQVGFKIMAVAALFSTASAVNATLFGGAKVSYRMAQIGELPEFVERHVWRDGREGLLITAACVLLLANIFNLSGIAMMGSSVFLVVYAAVSVGHIRIRSKTSAQLWILIVAIFGCIASLTILITYMWQNQRSSLWALLGLMVMCYVGELLLRHFGGRLLHKHHGAES